MVEILITRTRRRVPLPSYAHPGDAGADLVTTVDVRLEPGERALVPTGIAIALPEGYVALVHPRSGLAARFGVSIVNAPGTVDAGYRGEIKVLLVNLDPREPVDLCRGDRIAQLVVQRVEQARFVEVDRLPGSARGDGGYGSTGGFVERRPEPARTHDRRRRSDVPTQEADAGRRRGRRGAGTEAAAADDRPPRTRGPTAPGTSSEVDLDEDDASASTWAACWSPRRPGLDLQLQVDEAAAQVVAVVLAGETGAVELRAFAAPRNGDIWDDVRRSVAAEVARRAAPRPRPRAPGAPSCTCR